MRTQLDVIMDVEAELARHGYADPSASLFRGCHICFLPHPKLQASPSEGVDDHHQAATASRSGQRLFQSTREVAKSAADAEQALLACQAKRTSLEACTPYHLACAKYTYCGCRIHCCTACL